MKHLLHNFTIVRTKNGRLHVYFKDVSMFSIRRNIFVEIGNGKYIAIEEYDDTLTHSYNSEWNIIEIYKPHNYVGDFVRELKTGHIDSDKLEVIWTRNSRVEELLDKYSKEEIEQALEIMKEGEL